MNRPKLTKNNYYQDTFYYNASLIKSMYQCPASAIATLHGEYEKPKSTALLIGSYVDAWFEGEKIFQEFKNQTPEIFNLRTGKLKSEYIQADAMIQRAAIDTVFMSYCKGQKQKIMTGEICGLPFKCKIDFYKKGEYITDLKTCKDFEPIYLPGQGKVSFAEAYNYPLQMAIYQELVFQNTGERLPCYLACVTKQTPPDIAVIEIPQATMDAEMEVLIDKLPLLDAMREGIIEPIRCDKCAYCRETKKIDKPIRLDELEESL